MDHGKPGRDVSQASLWYYVLRRVSDYSRITYRAMECRATGSGRREGAKIDLITIDAAVTADNADYETEGGATTGARSCAH